jgi:hypothetical protein
LLFAAASAQKTLVNSVFVAALSQARGISKALNYT